MNIFFSDESQAYKYNGNSRDTKAFGASESSLIELARNLSLLGHNVVVVTNLEGEPAVYDGVQYLPNPLRDHSSLLNGFDIGVFNRSIEATGALEDSIKVKKKYLWCHDRFVHHTHNWGKFFNEYEKMICVSDFLRDYLLNEFRRPLKIKKILTGIDIERYKPVEHSSKYSVAFLGSVVQCRGVYDIISSFEKALETIPQLELHFIGTSNVWGRKPKNLSYEEDLDDALMSFINRNKYNVKVYGDVPVNQVPEILKTIRILLYPSRLETFCVAVLEAQACGVPVITGSTTALAERGYHRDTIYFSDYNADSLSKAVIELVNNEELYQKIRNNARAMVVKNYDWKTIVKQWEEEFAS